jgi:protein-tyrosine-phosphatase
MAEVSGGMVALALQAFLAGDAEQAHEVIARDRTADALYAEVFRQFLSHMMEDVRNVQRATRVQAVAKYLERIADHATNVGELVVFMVKGQDIRHRGEIQGRRVPHGVLFLCVHNSARSQMAEGWARELFAPGVHVTSAGSQPASQLNPYAVRVMQEVGIDISQHRPKHISEVALGDVDTVITLCEEEVCEDLPGILRRETWVFPDLAEVSGSESEIEDASRRVRDGIRARIEAFLKPEREDAADSNFER